MYRLVTVCFLLFVAVSFFLVKTFNYYRLKVKRLSERKNTEFDDRLIMKVEKEEEFIVFFSASRKRTEYPINWFYEDSIIDPSGPWFGANRKRIFLWEETGFSLGEPAFSLKGILVVSGEAYDQIRKYLKHRPTCGNFKSPFVNFANSCSET